MKRRFGDRKDGKLLRDIHVLHVIMPQLYKNRCDNEAFISECIDLTNVMAYLEKKNADHPPYKYNLFQVMVTAMLKCITLRPKMNRFICNQTMYQRNEISAAFTVKKVFSDNGAEALAIVRSKPEDTIDTIHDEIYRQVSICRSDKLDDGLQAADLVCKAPRFLLNMTVKYLIILIDLFEVCFAVAFGVIPIKNNRFETGEDEGYHNKCRYYKLHIFNV